MKLTKQELLNLLEKSSTEYPELTNPEIVIRLIKSVIGLSEALNRTIEEGECMKVDCIALEALEKYGVRE